MGEIMGELMTAGDVREWVQKLTAPAIDFDDEAQHSMEDEIHHAVLRAIASDQSDDPQAMAAEALKSLELHFSRWCA